MIKTIIVLVILIAILSYFGFDLKNIFESDLVQKNFNYVWQGIIYVWNNFLVQPVHFLWDFFINFVWNPISDALKGLQRLRNNTMS